ncbi:hypothetical protein HHI36_010406 [Cryptolaemus montrouzieri]|uniref:Uncharacterized protein n=1 Tax=Cryptolaemus montrouzieri TaxID=559131 RepID=A0ABD2MIP3_9CUCU
MSWAFADLLVVALTSFWGGWRMHFRVNMNRGVIIAGDFNVPFGTSERETVRLCDLMESYGFQPVVKNNTRRDACLDNILLNFEIDSATIEARDFNISDHDGQLINIPGIHTSKSTPNTKSTFTPVTLMRIMLVLKTPYFHGYAGGGMVAAFPEMTYCNKKSSYIKHWYRDELRKMRDHLSFLGDVCKRCGSLSNLGAFKIFKNKHREEL